MAEFDTLDLTFWEDADGDRHALTDPDLGLVLQGRTDFGMPAIERVKQEVPGLEGATLLGTKIKTREIDLKLRVDAPTYAAKWLVLRRVVRWFNPLMGSGRLIVQGVDGFERYLRCSYSDGLGLDEQPDQSPYEQEFVLVLEADDPLWYDEEPEQLQFGLDLAGDLFPIFPITLGSSAVIANPVLSNPCDAWARPVWTITGPATEITLENRTTGEVLHWEGTLAEGQTLVIDTRRDQKTAVILPDTSVYSGLGMSRLWPLAPGDNEVAIVIVGAEPSTTVAMEFERSYLSC
jgi:hypothetical protein